MKFLVALLALPAVLAAPTELAARQNPPHYVQDNVACACVNASGAVDPSISCPYGEKLNDEAGPLGLAGYCVPVSAFSAPMDKIMEPLYFCQQYAAEGFKTVNCKTVKQCLRFPTCPSFSKEYDVCGMPPKTPGPYCY
ncbi:hypothetical protein GGTG_11523 [Gaeumannomyces tritici R3-111a-1]|uniref:SSCRP protein n=1 Tax=Gaeumannomyces tritici (strain R3-111a-1) TaxID=644352 RepID=J3PDF2_GAET3|nr:hypothetical protein GGTG_11523 [Gaeumannomyces tritici R3-111a-1]EJT70500.1 hypothetical protein GGTG_11523 [Gaeumannomyces tritici R3-111a-1]